MKNVQRFLQINDPETTSWQVLDIPDDQLPSQRFHAIVAPLDKTRILIFGGRFNASWRELRADAFVIDTT